MSKTKIITESKNNNRSRTLNILISRVAYPIMLKLVKLFLKLIEVGFYGKNLSITLSWKHARFFENDWIKTIGTRTQNCQKSFK